MSSLFFHSATRFRKTKICGCRRTVLLGFAGRCEAGEGAFQSHPPFNLHTFRPCHFPLKSSFHEGFKPLFASLGHIAPTLAKSGAGMPPCPRKAHTAAHRGQHGADRVFSSPSPLSGGFSALIPTWHHSASSCAVASAAGRGTGLDGRRGRSLPAASRLTLSSMYSRVAWGTYFSYSF